MVTVTVPAKTYEISRCYNECPYFGTTMENMECNHPDIDTSQDAYARMIISHPDCDNGFPEKCPLRNELDL